MTYHGYVYDIDHEGVRIRFKPINCGLDVDVFLMHDSPDLGPRQKKEINQLGRVVHAKIEKLEDEELVMTKLWLPRAVKLTDKEHEDAMKWADDMHNYLSGI